MKNLVFRILLSLLSVTLLLLTVEVGMRTVQPRIPEASTTSIPHYDRSHARYVPEDARLNPWAAHATGSVFRVAVIGDSFTVGGGSSLTIPMHGAWNRC